MKETSCVNTAYRKYLHQMLHKQSLKHYKNKVLISNHKTDILLAYLQQTLLHTYKRSKQVVKIAAKATTTQQSLTSNFV